MGRLPEVNVLKASGEYEPFSEEKVRSSLSRAEVSGEFQDQVVSRLRKKLYDGISTKEIYQEISSLLKRLKPPLASRYHLKQAIMELGPEGFVFEKFVAGILQQEGYRVEVGQIIQGKCVSHEVDVVAQKGDQHFMIECKFHNQPGTKSDIKVALYTYARFLDVRDAWVRIAGHQNKFHQGWLVTNTKVTSEVISYGNCVGLRIISWNYPHDFSLRLLVEKKELFPITVLQSLPQSAREELLANGVVFCRDLVLEKIKFLPVSVVKKAKEEAGQVIGLV